MPTSFSNGIRRSPNASNCCCDSQISLTRRPPSAAMKATWYSSPSGGKSPPCSRRRIVSSYCSVVTDDAGVNLASMLMSILRDRCLGDPTLRAPELLLLLGGVGASLGGTQQERHHGVKAGHDEPKADGDVDDEVTDGEGDGD